MPQDSDSVYTITGKVFYSQDNAPIVGANIMVEGTMLGTSADADGKFIIFNVPRNKNLLDVRYLGVRPVLVELDIDSSIEKLFVQIGLQKDEDFVGFPKTLEIDKEKTSNWKTIKPNSPFTFKLPKNLKLDKRFQIIGSETMDVRFDYGYGGPVRFNPEMKDFSKVYWIIGCRVAEVVSYKMGDENNEYRYHMSAYFGQWYRFKIWINYKNKADYEIAKNILASIQFK